MTEKENYNGWTNYETWNVFLWISNDEGLYHVARECRDYGAFVAYLRDNLENAPIAIETPDHVAWNDTGINVEEINEHRSDL